MDRALEHCGEPLQRVTDVPVRILGLLNMKRWREDELVAVLEPPVKRRDDRGTSIACHAHRARRQCRLLAEERHRQPILEKIAIGEDSDQFSTLQRHHHPSEPTRSHLFEMGATAYPQIGHRGVDELRHGAGH